MSYINCKDYPFLAVLIFISQINYIFFPIVNFDEIFFSKEPLIVT